MPFRYQGSCEKTILTLYSWQKSRNRRFRNRIDFSQNSASIRGTFSVICHVFSVYFFGIDFRIDVSLILHGFGGSRGAWFGRAVARAVQHRTPGDTPMVGTGGPRDARGGLGSRQGWLLVVPWSNITNFFAFPWL